MEIRETKLSGCYILEPKKYYDDRGYFFESFNEAKFNDLTGASVKFVQDNQSFSSRGVLRGLHAQRDEYAQAKLVRVLQGCVMDIGVDIRKDSPTFGQHVHVELSDENNLQLFLPRGFLHAFVVLSDSAVFFYKCDNYYNKAAEYGVRFDDARLGIDWNLPTEDLIVSEKDLKLPTFDELFG